MIAERPDIGACSCVATPCVCPAVPTRIHLIPCALPGCAAATSSAWHYHPCTYPGNVCRHPDCEHNTGDRPQRIQLRRTKGWRKPPSITVARPTRWGNPYKVGTIVADPVNSINPIASIAPEMAAPARASLPREFERRSYDGRPWTQRYYVIESAAQAVDLYRRWMRFHCYDVSSLRGHDLACWCPLDQPCHADVLLELANQ